MNIQRWNSDFGNSSNDFMVDGYYFEIPTNVVEIPEKQAETLFTTPISDPKDLLDRLLISTTYDDHEHFFLVGGLAEVSKLSSQHVHSMHDKINSIVPYASFLGAAAYYRAIKLDNPDDFEISIEHMNMMLPIWLLKRAEKFSIAQQQMAARFIGEHHFKILTPGMKAEITLNVKASKCYVESEIARHALKYKMVKDEKDEKTIKIEKRSPIIDKFANFEVVLSDIGGGTIDAAKLGKGLTAPRDRDSFQVIDVEPFLGELDKLRREKLIKYFHDLLSFEKFIVENYENQKYVLKDGNTGQQYDFTDIIKEMLQNYSDVLIAQNLRSYQSSDEVLKFIYFGGETPVLAPYIKKSLKEYMSEQAVENNHFILTDLLEDDQKEVFTPNCRTVNLAALELLSINEQNKITSQNKQ